MARKSTTEQTPLTSFLLGLTAFGLGLWAVARSPSGKSAMSPVLRSSIARRRWREAIVPFPTQKILLGKSKKTGKERFGYVVTEMPGELRAKAEKRLGRAINPSAFSIAAVMATEAGGLPEIGKIAVGYATWNEARRRGLHVDELVAPKGQYGSQTYNPYAATRLPPSFRDLELAEGILGGTVSDPTGGATNWDSPALQDRLAAAGDPSHPKTADDVARARINSGKEPVYLPGISPRQLRFWRARA